MNNVATWLKQDQEASVKVLKFQAVLPCTVAAVAAELTQAPQV
jgi:hypothetical protein